MSTLEEAVESGRRWRHPNWQLGLYAIGTFWAEDDGTLRTQARIPVSESLSSDFEIVPEDRHRECGKYCNHQSVERPRERWLHDEDCKHPKHPKDIICGCCHLWHDASACDRLKANS